MVLVQSVVQNCNLLLYGRPQVHARTRVVNSAIQEFVEALQADDGVAATATAADNNNDDDDDGDYQPGGRRLHFADCHDLFLNTGTTDTVANCANEGSVGDEQRCVCLR